ncbi:MAG: ABC transporter ATP-binding protein/permease, partial [Humibacillus sp.]|nr:ABC transporter ATP-binding protein/permease [Humibacillus sp.]
PKIDPPDRAQLDESPVSMRRVVALFRPHRRTVAIVTATVVLISVISMASPFLLRAVIDDALPHQNVRLLLWAVGGMLAVTIVTQLLGVVQTWLTTAVGQRVMHGLRTDVFRHLQRQSIAFFTRTRSGEVQSRLTNDISGVQSVITSTATSIASNVTTAIATIVAMVALSPRLSLLSLFVIPPAIWMTRRVALLRRDITTALQRRLADLQSQVEEGLSVSGATLIKTLGAGPATADRFTVTSGDLIDLELRSQLAGRWRLATMQIIFAAIPALIYLAAGFPATSGGMTIGTLIAFTTLQAGIFRPLMGLLNVGAQWVTSMALFSRIFGYLDLPVDVAPPAHPVTVDPDRVRGVVHFEGVRFSYEPDAAEPRLAVGDVTLDIPAGTTLALVGETGSGKSTLAGLLSRLHDPSAGRVTVDGIDLRDLAPEDLARMVGVVSQDTYLVHASIRDNLLLAAPEASEPELWQALDAAQVSALVAGLPDQLDTLVGARGHRFSGGEKQRLAIARTLLRNPRVLILDEATSALDNETERELQTAIDRLMAGRTTLTIAHRLSTIRDAEQIAVLDHGHVVELGHHDELMARDGRYARLATARSEPSSSLTAV